MSPMMQIIAAAAARRNGGAGDADALDYFSRVALAGGTLSTETKSAVAAFVASAKSHGYWSQLNRINLICGDWPAAIVPLKIGGGTDTESPNGYSATDYTEALGITGKGTGQTDTYALDTGYSPAADDPSDWGCFAYIAGVTTQNTYYLGLTRDSPATYTGLGSVVGSLSGYIASTGSTAALDTNPTSGHVGLFGVVASGSRTAQLYRNGAAVGTTATLIGSFVPGNIYVMARHHLDTSTRFPMRPEQAMRAYAITRGLTSTQVADFSNDLNTFEAALGRNVY